MVVLAGYKTVKEALVDHGEEFGDRDQIEILKELNGEHGKERQKCFSKSFSISCTTPLPETGPRTDILT